MIPCHCVEGCHTKATVSADGKTMTAMQTGKNAQGQSLKNVIVLDKQ